MINSVSVLMRALRTNGDGACGMHALFGTLVFETVSNGYELFCPGARVMAAQYLGSSLEELEQRAGVEEHVHAIKTNFWDGFVVAHLQGPRSSESEIFWQCLLAYNPSLAQEALDTVNAQRATNPGYQAAKNEVLEASRRFFTRDL